MSFTYNDEGIRTSKTVNNVMHTYHLNGSQIVAEEWEDNILVYLYDASGSPIGMMYRTDNYPMNHFDVFWYEKNLQGDIVAVYDEDGTKLATYTYSDAWGNHNTIYSNGGGTSPAQYNPFRYRGYYYDTDLQMYYLQSRYYDSKICRFINADSYVSTGQGVLGNNMFAYCGNNPVNRVDPTGNIWWLVAAVAVVIVACTAILSRCSTSPEPTPLPYATPDDAAMAFANSVYSSSRYIRHEYGTIIYSVTIDGTTTYDFATPVSGTPHSVGYRDVILPLGTTAVATAHTHPNSNNFSGIEPGAISGDVPNAIRRGLDSYVVGPNLILQKYSVSSGTISTVGVASPILLTSQQQAALVAQFSTSWTSHLGTCGFGCEHMVWPTP